MKIIIDAMGGDNAPDEIVLGALRAAKEFQTEVVLVGRGEEILRGMKANGLDNLPEGVEIANAEDMVDMHADPTQVVQQHRNSSMVVGLKMLADGAGDAFISAGNSGALLTAATLLVKRIRGIRRAAFAPLLPTEKDGAILIDAGANIECTPEFLMQFGCMGALYAQKALGIPQPRVALLNNGAEDTKGDPLRKAAYDVLKAAGDAGRINFIGNVEGSDIPNGACDVAVTDGFTGNILLKTVEGVAGFLMGTLKDVFLTSARTKLAYLLVKPAMGGLKKMMSSKEVGGAPFLGISKPVFKAHGSSDAYAIRSAVKQAIAYVNADVVGEIQRNIDNMTL